jgi:creatinine amidohydrolase
LTTRVDAPRSETPSSGTARLDAVAWPAVAGVSRDRLLVLPLGSTEQHGPHLPFTTDTDIAIALAEQLAARRDNVVVAPALPYGSSGEHAAFAGTLSLGASAFEHAVVELVRSADAFAGVVLVSAHGGNAEPLASAVRTLTTEGRRVLAWSPAIADGDAHAGRTETSMVLALRPEAVSLERAEAGDTRPLAALLPALRSGGVAAVSANGVLGDPAEASATEGAALLRSLADDLADAVRRWAP